MVVSFNCLHYNLNAIQSPELPTWNHVLNYVGTPIVIVFAVYHCISGIIVTGTKTGSPLIPTRYQAVPNQPIKFEHQNVIPHYVSRDFLFLIFPNDCPKVQGR